MAKPLEVRRSAVSRVTVTVDSGGWERVALLGRRGGGELGEGRGHGGIRLWGEAQERGGGRRAGSGWRFLAVFAKFLIGEEILPDCGRALPAKGCW